MPKPPPRFSSASSSPVAWCTWPSRPTTRCAAASKPAVSKICEPMWLGRPGGGGPEAGGAKDRGADVAVQAGEPQRRLPDHPDGGGQCVAGGQREAELL